MKLTLKMIKELSSLEIYGILSKTFDDLYRKYNFLNISKKEFDNIVLQKISESKVDYSGNSYTKYIQDKVINFLDNEITKKINDINFSYDLINNYIFSRSELWVR